jgi:hypothetical protein
MTIDKTTEKRFWEKVDKSGGPDGCWLWTGGRSREYGVFGYQGRTIRAHRFSWMLENGREIPPGMDVHHDCGNARCVNPRHLTPMAHAQNMAQSALRGAWSGERNGRSKLTERKVRIFRLLRSVYVPVKEIARRSRTPVRTVYNALNGGWTHI